MSHCAVNNIKASCKLLGLDITAKLRFLASNNLSVSKKKSNFFVFRDKCVYIIFYTGHVNITGARSRSALDEARNYLSTVVEKFELKLSCVTIDNICLSGKLPTTVNLIHFSDKLLQHCITFCYNPRKFPGLSFASAERRSGTTIVFASGKFIIVGLKEEDQVIRAEAHLIDLINKYG